MRILLAEDNAELAQWLGKLLRRDRFVIDSVDNGIDADEALQTQDYALAILDLGLPQRDGLTVLRNLRARGQSTPVIVLTARDAVEDRVAGLDSGADDYIVKPFDVTELEARIRAQLRRTAPIVQRTLECGPLEFHCDARDFSLAGAPLALTPREHAVLERLVRDLGRVTPKSALADSVFGFDDDANPNAVEIYVHRVRKKIEGSGVMIATLRGLGYALRASNGAA
jgi:two-component system, OmpR family, response regulator TctD